MASSDGDYPSQPTAQGAELGLSLVKPKTSQVSVPLMKLLQKWSEKIVDNMTAEAAREHIDFIRQDEGFDDHGSDEVLGSNASKLTRALNVLSDQLYTQPTHFLLEFIQNADDNHYTGVLPTLTFVSRPGTLNINCNETGFRPKNVEALCDIGNSTKRDRSKGFIGEKGIGFKSVFKIAKHVHISSNAYSFRFDREGPLGMIAPIWCDYPGTLQNGFTQFFLTLSKEKNGQSEYELRGQLRQLDSTLLLFLRNLREISVDIDNGTQTKQGRFVKHICRQDYEEYGGEMIKIHGDRQWLRRLPEDAEYLVVRHTVVEMPEEPKRHGMSSSEIVLAFPFKAGKPTFTKQKAYAFLPIRESGFRFLLQADFLLIANREDVEQTKWNDALLLGFAAGFVNAVARFNHPEALALRYMWPGFLQDMPSSKTTSFSLLAEQIVAALAKTPVLESDSGYFVKPTDAVFVPARFRDKRGIFLLQDNVKTLSDTGIKQKEYISNKYEQVDPKLEVLQKLGVEIMSFCGFLDLLREYIQNNPEVYKAKPVSWHSTLAQIILDMASEPQASSLPLIPLRDGRWVRRVDGQCYFETDDATVYSRLPEGIPTLLIVQTVVHESPVRVQLLHKLGVRDLTRIEVCRLLLACHETPHACELETDALVSHAKYLFEVIKAEVQIPKPKTFWVHDFDRKARVAVDTYLDTKDATIPRMSVLLPPDQCSGRLLHQSYALEYAGRRQETWLTWLQTFLGLRSVLRIADANHNLTPELRFLAENQPSELMLEAFAATASKEKSAFELKKVRDMVGALVVTCVNGARARLSQTCLPTARVRGLAIEGLLFVKVSNPDADKWMTLLEKFGVVVKPDLEFYLRCLSLNIGKPISIEGAKQLYKEIENHASESFERVQAYFLQNDAIYIPDGQLWLNKSMCVWSGTPGLAGEQPLSDIYPTLHNFFWFHLKIQSATTESVIDRLINMSMPGNDDPDLRKKLLFSLSRRLAETTKDLPKLRRLENVVVVPIAPKYGMEATRLASLNRSTWLFADQHDYYESFKDHEKVSFAAFSVEDFFRIEKLCDAISKLWDVDSERRLSRLVKEEMIVGAQFVFNPTMTAAFRGKLKFLRRIVRHNGGPPRIINEKLKHLHQARVSCTNKISYRILLTQGQLGKTIEGKPIVRNSLHKAAAGEVGFYLLANADEHDQQSALGHEFCSFCGINEDRLQFVVEKIMQSNNAKQLQDLLLKKGIEGYEEQEYVPLPVQSLQPVPAAVSSPASASASVPTRQLLSALSGNVRQQAAAPIPQSSIDPASKPDTEPPQANGEAVNGGDWRDLQTGAVTERTGFSAPEQTTRLEPARGRDELRATRAHEGRVSLRIGSSPLTLLASETLLSQRSDQYSVPRSRPANSSSRARVSESDDDTSPPAFVIRHLGSTSLAGAGFSNRYSRVKTAKDIRREQDIGIKGEVFVWKKLKEILGDDLDHEVWTSELRGEAKLDLGKWRPQDPNATYADFTVPDTENRLAQWLANKGVDVPSEGQMTYHIEVKTTTAHIKEPFHMSHLQKELCEDLRSKPGEVFIIFRVFEVDGRSKGLAVLPDPWLTPGLRVEAVDYIVLCENTISPSDSTETDDGEEDGGSGSRERRKSDCTVA